MALFPDTPEASKSRPLKSLVSVELETLYKDYNAPPYDRLEGYHVLYFGALFNQGFRNTYGLFDDRALRRVCVELFFALPYKVTHALMELANKEYCDATEDIDREKLVDDGSPDQLNFAIRRLRLHKPISDAAASLINDMSGYFPTGARYPSPNEVANGLAAWSGLENLRRSYRHRVDGIDEKVVAWQAFYTSVFAFCGFSWFPLPDDAETVVVLEWMEAAMGSFSLWLSTQQRRAQN